MDNFSLYNDIAKRTKGEFFLGVVGPVRTGKSTFIKRFMDVCVLPNLPDDYNKQILIDELPQSATGKTITTTEPKFVPKEACEISLNDEVKIQVRLVDCVGFMVDGAKGHMENDLERMVKTPWLEEEIPFTKAAEIGTKKVIKDHATIGIVMTCDGSMTDMRKEDYIEATKRTIEECKETKKPFVVILNSEAPYAEEVKNLAMMYEQDCKVPVLRMNVAQLTKEDINTMLNAVLLEFPISQIEFYSSHFVEQLPLEHPFKDAFMKQCMTFMNEYKTMGDILNQPLTLSCPYLEKMKTEVVDLSTGLIKIELKVEDDCYYELLSQALGEPITNDYELLETLSSLGDMKKAYTTIAPAVMEVKQKGYSVMKPVKSEIVLGAPELIKHGNKYGVKMKAESPSVHLIKAGIVTEIAPLVGTKEQAEDLISYINNASREDGDIWKTNIFGKNIEQLVEDGILSKLSLIGEESQIKLQESMQKIVNETSGGIICIII